MKKKRRRAITVDETKIRIKEWLYLWAAIDVDSCEVLGVYVSKSRSCLDSFRFLREVLKFCEGEPLVYVDSGHWYPWALNRLGLPLEHHTFGLRNPIEKWFGIKTTHKVILEKVPANSSKESIYS